MVGRRPTPSVKVGDVAALVWRIDRNEEPRALLDIVDELHVNDDGAFDRLIEMVRPRSAAVAVQLASRQVSVALRIRALATIAIQIAEAEN